MSKKSHYLTFKNKKYREIVLNRNSGCTKKFCLVPFFNVELKEIRLRPSVAKTSKKQKVKTINELSVKYTLYIPTHISIQQQQESC